MFDAYTEGLFIYTGILIVMAWSLYLPLAAGQFYVAQPGLIAIAAYTSAVASKAGVPFGLSLVMASSLVTLVGLLLAFPALRLGQLSMCIATMGFSEIVRVIFLNLRSLGGAAGLRAIPLSSDVPTIAVILVVLAIFLYRLEHSRLGRAIWALKLDETAAQTMGVNTRGLKFVIVAASSFIAGLGGTLYAHYTTFIDPSLFGFRLLLNIFVFCAVGGTSTFWGPALGAAFLWLLPEFVGFLGAWRGAFYAAVLILVMLFRPSGLITRNAIGRIPIQVAARRAYSFATQGWIRGGRRG